MGQPSATERPGKEKAIRVIVPGRPVPKGRPGSGAWATAYIYTPESTRAYEQLVGMCARAAAPAPLQGPVEMRAVIYLHRGRRGDLDNYLKCICDGLNKIAWLDDGQVVRIEAEIRRCKKADDQRVEIEIREARGNYSERSRACDG